MSKRDEETLAQRLQDVREFYDKFLLDDVREDGYEDGLQEGRIEGIEIGRAKEREKTALKMLKANYSYEEIAELTQLSLDEIKNLVHTKL